MKNKNKLGVYVHGEAFLHAISHKIPASAVKIGADAIGPNGYFIIADSETTGNHHVIDVVDGVDMFKDGDKIYMNSSVDTKIRCVHADRHDAITIPAGTYEFGIQQEYDPFTARMQKVQD
jgi:hypothetical protein